MAPDVARVLLSLLLYDDFLDDGTCATSWIVTCIVCFVYMLYCYVPNACKLCACTGPWPLKRNKVLELELINTDTHDKIDGIQIFHHIIEQNEVCRDIYS